MNVNKLKSPKEWSRPAESEEKSKKGIIDVYFNKYQLN